MFPWGEINIRNHESGKQTLLKITYLLSGCSINMNQIVLFDGICNLCNSSVRFVLKNDKSKSIKVASLQSETGKNLLQQAGLPENSIDTVIYFRGEIIYQRSEAVLQVLKDMGGLWRLFYGFIIVPPFIRDFFYNVIARYRYRIFGKRDQCTL